MKPAEQQFADRVAAVRRFSRFYTRQIGALDEGLLGSDLSLGEARIIYELARRQRATATEIGVELSLDAGYLSRLLRGLEQRNLIKRQRSPIDARQSLISLTNPGRETFGTLDARSSEETAAMLNKLSPIQQRQLVEAMVLIEQLFGGRPEPRVPYILRMHQPGDMGWIVHRHGLLYAQEYGWDETFEAVVAETVAKFIRTPKPKRERCWIAEREGEIVGSVLLTEKSNSIGELGLLYVEPNARGLGMGRRLVEECIRFAQQAGYAKIALHGYDVFTSAREIFERTGWRLVLERQERCFGQDLVGQGWELVLPVEPPRKGPAAGRRGATA